MPIGFERLNERFEKAGGTYMKRFTDSNSHATTTTTRVFICKLVEPLEVLMEKMDTEIAGDSTSAGMVVQICRTGWTKERPLLPASFRCALERSARGTGRLLFCDRKYHVRRAAKNGIDPFRHSSRESIGHGVNRAESSPRSTLYRCR